MSSVDAFPAEERYGKHGGRFSQARSMLTRRDGQNGFPGIGVEGVDGVRSSFSRVMDSLDIPGRGIDGSKGGKGSS